MNDYQAIIELTAKYNRAFDNLQTEDLLATWTEDGFFERSNAGRSYQGHAELDELLHSFPVRGRHMTSDFIIEISGDTARQSCYLAYYDINQDYKMVMFGTYADELDRKSTRLNS